MSGLQSVPTSRPPADQLSTLEEAKYLARQLNRVGGGVADITDDPDTSGIYIPKQYYGESPQDGEYKLYHFRFKCGRDGINVGLVRNVRRMSSHYAWLTMIAEDVGVELKPESIDEETLCTLLRNHLYPEHVETIARNEKGESVMAVVNWWEEYGVTITVHFRRGE